MLKPKRNFLRLRHAKAHDDGALKNPLFVKTTPSKLLKILYCAFGICVLIGIGIGTTYIEGIQIKTIEIHGAATLDESQIRSEVTRFIADAALPLCSKTNQYAASTDSISSKILNTFSVQSVFVQRIKNGLDITIEEKITTVALRTKERTVMIDTTGKYIRDATRDESRAIDIKIKSANREEGEVLTQLQLDMPIILNTQNDTSVELSQDLTEKLVAISEQLPSVGYHAIFYVLDGINAEYVKVDTSEEYDLFFDISTRSIEDQIRALHAVIVSQNFIAPKEYIDLRFGAYIYQK